MFVLVLVLLRGFAVVMTGLVDCMVDWTVALLTLGLIEVD